MNTSIKVISAIFLMLLAASMISFASAQGVSEDEVSPFTSPNLSEERVMLGQNESALAENISEEIEEGVSEVRPSQELETGEEAKEKAAEQKESATAAPQTTGFEIVLSLVGMLAIALALRVRS